MIVKEFVVVYGNESTYLHLITTVYRRDWCVCVCFCVYEPEAPRTSHFQDSLHTFKNNLEINHLILTIYKN